MSNKALVVDANILIRAVLGKRVRELVLDNAATVKFFAPTWLTRMLGSICPRCWKSAVSGVASNDENMLIIKGHRKLAAAYATHVMDVYDHYRWRYQLQSKPQEAAYAGLDKTPAWQDKYFSNGGATPTQEIVFWLGE